MMKQTFQPGDTVRYGVNVATVLAVTGQRATIEIVSNVSLYQGDMVRLPVSLLVAL